MLYKSRRALKMVKPHLLVSFQHACFKSTTCVSGIHDVHIALYLNLTCYVNIAKCMINSGKLINDETTSISLCVPSRS